MDFKREFMNKFECVVIINSKLKNVEYIKKELLNIIGDLNVSSYEDIGNKILAYEIKREKEGHYIKIEFYTNNTEIIENLENYLEIDKNILKFIVLKIKDRKEIEFGKQLTEILDIYTEDTWTEEPLDETEVDNLINLLRIQLNFINGNINNDEYLEKLNK